MAEVALEFLLNNFKDQLIKHVNEIKDSRGFVESMQRNLPVFKAFLRDSVSIRKRNEVTKVMVKEIHDVVYEIEDIIELCLAKPPKSWSPKMEEIKGRVEGCRHLMYNIVSHDEVQPEKAEVRPPRKKDVVGFEDVTEDLISRLLQETGYHLLCLIL